MKRWHNKRFLLGKALCNSSITKPKPTGVSEKNPNQCLQKIVQNIVQDVLYKSLQIWSVNTASQRKRYSTSAICQFPQVTVLPQSAKWGSSIPPNIPDVVCWCRLLAAVSVLSVVVLWVVAIVLLPVTVTTATHAPTTTPTAATPCNHRLSNIKPLDHIYTLQQNYKNTLF